MKGLTHVSAAHERVAILLVEGQNEVLLGIPEVERVYTVITSIYQCYLSLRGTAEMIEANIITALTEHGVNKDKIAGLVFDATAVTAGIRNSETI